MKEWRRIGKENKAMFTSAKCQTSRYDYTKECEGERERERGKMRHSHDTTIDNRHELNSTAVKFLNWKSRE
jgi:hypothetical protein